MLFVECLHLIDEMSANHILSFPQKYKGKSEKSNSSLDHFEKMLNNIYEHIFI